MLIHAPPSTAYWNVTLPADPMLLTTISRSPTAPSGASELPLGSTSVTDGSLPGATFEDTTAVVLTGALLLPCLSSSTMVYVCEPSLASSSVHESEPFALAAPGSMSASFSTRYAAPLAAAGWCHVSTTVFPSAEAPRPVGAAGAALLILTCDGSCVLCPEPSVTVPTSVYV